MNNLIFILFETDIYKTKSSRIFKGVFTDKEIAEDFANENKIESTISCAEIIEIEADTFYNNI
ncbi:hypothetical protein LNP80_22865 [Chryseobacterium sp. C-39]|uniref:DUF7336 domain-containing protein n=1 Tax=Chryseobacterium muglaense TaxID=2893752 RepID=A0A9Q3YVP2_9FLAO|nr:hypothetical protein [Chryseobacterium muglaense]MCC9037057.1 hypothetical protein [Chryseobacterium muglaense]